MDETSLEGRGGCAEVRAYGRLFRYRRSGTGTPVLVLRAPDGSGIDTDLAAGLGARLALIEPRMSELEADAAPWLACFLEGLGTAEIGILADHCFGEEAVALARISPHQVARIAVVRRGPAASDPAPVDGSHDVGGLAAAALQEASVPLLVVDLDSADPARPAARLADFLGGPAAASRPLDRPGSAPYADGRRCAAGAPFQSVPEHDRPVDFLRDPDPGARTRAPGPSHALHRPRPGAGGPGSDGRVRAADHADRSRR